MNLDVVLRPVTVVGWHGAPAEPGTSRVKDRVSGRRPSRGVHDALVGVVGDPVEISGIVVDELVHALESVSVG